MQGNCLGAVLFTFFFPVQALFDRPPIIDEHNYALLCQEVFPSPPSLQEHDHAEAAHLAFLFCQDAHKHEFTVKPQHANDLT